MMISLQPHRVLYDRCSNKITLTSLKQCWCVLVHVLGCVVINSCHLRQAVTQQLCDKYNLIISRADLIAQWFGSTGKNGQCTNKYSNVISRWKRDLRKSSGTRL